MCEKPLFTKYEYFNHLECKSQAKNANSYNWCLHSMICKLINLEKANTDFHNQNPTILTEVNCSFCIPSISDLCYTKQMALISITQLNLTNSSTPVHISSQAQHIMIFKFINCECFSCNTHSLLSIFDISRKATNSIKLSFAIVLYLFGFVLFFNKINFFQQSHILMKYASKQIRTKNLFHFLLFYISYLRFKHLIHQQERSPFQLQVILQIDTKVIRNMS